MSNTNNKKQSDKTAAETKSIGFEYQYYFFLWKVLALKSEESVGLEVKDDVHIQLFDKTMILYQLKHTIQKRADGLPKNLTDSDSDLWKTLSNWAKLISDKNDGRTLKKEQEAYLKNTSFVLATNKSSGSKSKILDNLELFREEQITFKAMKESIVEYSNDSKSEGIKADITIILSLGDSILKKFLLQVSFELDENNIIEKCKSEIRSDKVPEKRIDDVYRNIDSAIREDNFIDIRSGKKIEISFDDFFQKYRRFYDLARSPSLNITPFSGTMPNLLEDQIFIQQLLEIEDIKLENIEEITEFTRFRLMFSGNVAEWLQKGEITNKELDTLRVEAINQWKNRFRSCYRGQVEEPLFNEKGLSILDAMRNVNLEIQGQGLGSNMSNGKFYELANEPIIGWRKDWEKYKQ